MVGLFSVKSCCCPGDESDRCCDLPAQAAYRLLEEGSRRLVEDDPGGTPPNHRKLELLSSEPPGSNEYNVRWAPSPITTRRLFCNDGVPHNQFGEWVWEDYFDGPELSPYWKWNRDPNFGGTQSLVFGNGLSFHQYGDTSVYSNLNTIELVFFCNPAKHRRIRIQVDTEPAIMPPDVYWGYGPPPCQWGYYQNEGVASQYVIELFQTKFGDNQSVDNSHWFFTARTPHHQYDAPCGIMPYSYLGDNYFQLDRNYFFADKISYGLNDGHSYINPLGPYYLSYMCPFGVDDCPPFPVPVADPTGYDFRYLNAGLTQCFGQSDFSLAPPWYRPLVPDYGLPRIQGTPNGSTIGLEVEYHVHNNAAVPSHYKIINGGFDEEPRCEFPYIKPPGNPFYAVAPCYWKVRIAANSTRVGNFCGPALTMSPPAVRISRFRIALKQ